MKHSLVLCASILATAGCAEKPRIISAQATFLRSPTEVVGTEGAALAAGYLEVVLATNIDIRKYEDEGFNVWAEIHGCDSGVEMFDIQLAPHSRTLTLLVPYRDAGSSFNLARYREDVCATFGVGIMRPFGSQRSDPYRIDLHEGLLSEIREYDEVGGRISFERQDSL